MDYYDIYEDVYEDDYELFEDDAEIYQRNQPPPRYRPWNPRHPQVFPCPRGTTVYYARYGDTIQRVARAFGIRPNEIIRVNPDVDPRALYPGQRLCIPTRRR